MSPTVGVIVDPEDDLATTRAIHELAARDPAVLAISIAPDSRTSAAIVWAILRALGKRVEQLQRNPVEVWWSDAERWLAAHDIGEVAVLCAQHLDEPLVEMLKWRLNQLEITPILIYGGAVQNQRPATTTLNAWLAGEHRRAPSRASPQPWPRVPRSHPLRFRYDCAQQLAPAEFDRVDAILNSSFLTMRDWLSQRVSPKRRELISALRLISAAPNAEQAYIRRAGAETALIVDKIPIPRVRPLDIRARRLTAEEIDAAHAYANPATAAYHLAKLITGFSDDMLLLIGGDQITDDAILECAVPDRARPILRALDDYCDPILDVPWGPSPEPVDEATQANHDFAATLSALLRGRSTRVAAEDVPLSMRPSLEQLQAAGILDLTNRAYQASHIALFSSYLLPAAPVCARVDEADDLCDFPGCHEQLELIGDRDMPWYLNEVLEHEPEPETSAT
jgi:hypothetical protein